MQEGSKNPMIFFFIVVLCSICAIILASLATLLLPLQKKSLEKDEGKQMLLSAKILSIEGYFLVQDSSGVFIPAIYDPTKNILVPAKKMRLATSEQILSIAQKRIVPFLVDEKGDLKTFEEANMNYFTYVKEHQKQGYANLPFKLLYAIYSNDPIDKTIIGYIIPVNGFGLWGPIYGYLAIESDGKTVIGTTWYDQKETAGLGAEISTSKWQAQFYQKLIFQPTQQGDINIVTAPIGITVVKGTVQQVYKNSPKAYNAVDGISGASITGKGVTNAYKDSLEPYRPFLIKIGEEKNAS